MQMLKQISIKGKGIVSVKAKVKRGEKSWMFIRYIFTILLSIFTFIIAITNISWIYKFFIFLFGVISLFWLCFCNGWFQNKIIRLQTKIEETWR